MKRKVFCSANTSQNTLVFSCNVIKGVPHCTKAIYQHCLQRDLKQLHIRAQPRLLLWICSCVCEYGICSHKNSWKAVTGGGGETVVAQLEIMQIWWSCKVKAFLRHLALSTAMGNDILILQCFAVWMVLILNVSIYTVSNFYDYEMKKAPYKLCTKSEICLVELMCSSLTVKRHLID